MLVGHSRCFLSPDVLIQMTAETMGAIGGLIRDGYDFPAVIKATTDAGLSHMEGPSSKQDEQVGWEWDTRSLRGSMR